MLLPRSAIVGLISVLVGACGTDDKHAVTPPVVVPVEAIDASAPPVDAAPAFPAGTPFATGAPVTVDPTLVGTGKTHMVVSEARLATEVGDRILAAGGNAVDAAVATAFALAVVHPSAGNLGGGGFAVVRLAAGKVVTVDFRETAPGAATRDMYLDAAGNPTSASLEGALAAGVPGSVAGLAALHGRYGRLAWKQVLAPAIALAGGGFTIDQALHDDLAHAAPRLAHDPAAAALWLPGGEAPAAGAVVENPDLAATLRRIQAKGAAGFYQGRTAQLVAATMTAAHGIITEGDLRGYHAAWREPIAFDYRGYHLYTMPPPSSGGIVLAITAGIFEQLGPIIGAWHDAVHLGTLAEVWRRGYALRNRSLGDPAFVKDMPLARILAPEHLRALAATIGPTAMRSEDTPMLIEGNHTTNLGVIDGHGMAVAMTTTLNTGYGSGVLVAGAGFLLNNEMDDFTAKPGSPNVYGLVQGEANAIAPGKRMLSSMSPTVIEAADHELFMVVGAQGGSRIITAVWQVIANVIDYHMAVDVAVAAPRVHHQHLPDVLTVEPFALAEPTWLELVRRGYTLEWSKWPVGAVTAIVGSPATGWRGSVDPRGGGASTGD